MTEHKSLVFRFDDVEVREREFLLIKAGEALPVEPKAFRVLLFLLRNSGRLVTKDEVLGAVWNDCAASDNSLTRSIATLRRLLNDDTREPRYIATVPTVGYRFLCDVTVTNGFAGAASPQTAAEKVDSRTETSLEGNKEHATVTTQGPRSRRHFIMLGVALAAIIVAGFVLRRVIRRDRASRASHSVSASTTFAGMRVVPLTDLPGWAGYPALSPDGEKVAFIANNDTLKMGLYVQLVGGDRPLQLTRTHSGVLCCTNWSPDGREIAFARCGDNGGGVYVVPALGGPERKLTDVTCPLGDVGVKWTADGRSLVLTDQCTPGSPPGIVQLSLATGEKRCLHAPLASEVGDRQPAVSPDQKTVAFLKMPNANVSELYTVPLSGGLARSMTSDGNGVGGLMWSADGRRIVFNSNRDGSSRVWQVPATGGSILPELEYPEVGSLSRDGRRLAYQGSSGISGCSSTIWRAEFSRPGGVVVSQGKLFAPVGCSGGLQLSSNRKQIAFPSFRSGLAQIWKSDADGGNPLQMTFFDKGLAGTPRWSADDKQIVFDYSDPTHTQIYMIDSEGRNLHRITSGNYENVVPSWSRDGASIYFASNRTGGWQVWKHVLGTGAETQVTHGGGFAAFESYDAKTLYYSKFTGGGIWSVPSNGGEERHLTEALHLGDWGNFTVTEGGLYLVDSSTEPGPTIRYYNFQNRRTIPIIMLKQNALQGTSNLSSSRDGRTVLYAQSECKGSILMAEKAP
jgi:Tol biopolymer transport system component/DNA-binding winged helix-turn-helix (wHTH) protein